MYVLRGKYVQYIIIITYIILEDALSKAVTVTLPKRRMSNDAAVTFRRRCVIST